MQEQDYRPDQLHRILNFQIESSKKLKKYDAMKIKILREKWKWRWSWSVRSTLVLCLTGFFLISIYAEVVSKEIAPENEKISLTEALYRISVEYQVFFSYDQEAVQDVVVFYEPDRYENVEHALDRMLIGTSLHYRMFNNRYIILYESHPEAINSLKDMVQHLESVIDKEEKGPMRKLAPPLVALPARTNSFSVQKIAFSVSGTVTDQDGEPLIGVNIQVKGTDKGTSTDIDGKFKLEDIDENAILIISYVGYQTQEIPVAGKSSLEIVMVSDAELLDEVVVVGYGTQRREEVTSSIATVTEKDFTKGAITQSPLQLVQGKIAGLAMSRSSGGDPTAGVDIQLRGVSTVRGQAEPLIIIDGVPGGNLNNVSPEDVESINVLKDGSAAAIYGTRGNAGVIIITTKKGSPGLASIKYSTYFYTENWLKKPSVLNAEEWRQLKTDFENSSNSLLNSKAGSIVDYGADTDWLEEITNQTISQIHNVSISGGSNNTTYYGSLNYRDLRGFIKTSKNNILSGRLSLNHTAMDEKLSIQLNLNNSLRKADQVDYNSYRQALERNPTLPVYNEDGSFREISGFTTFNPLGMLLQYDQLNEYSNILGSARITYDLLSNLTLVGLGAYQRGNNLYGYYEANDAIASINGGYFGTAQRTANQAHDRTFEFNFEYTNFIVGGHGVNLLGGYSYQDFSYESFGARNRDFISNSFSYNNLGAGVHLPKGNYRNGDVFSEKESSKVIAFFGRLNYNYRGKYILSTSLRREGSSRFGLDHKWGLFPSISAGWMISEETFIQQNDFINELKLRIGYGVTGNQGIGNYISLQKLGTSGVMLYNGEWISGYAPASNPNPDLRWEKKAETNIGVDITFLNNNVNLTLDVYNRRTKDLLYEYVVPVPPNLYNTIWTNIGIMDNKGIEMALNLNLINKDNFTWSTDVNFSYNQNKLISLSNDEFQTKYQNLENIGAPGLNDTPAFRLEEGQPIGNFFGYKFADFTDDGKWLFWNIDQTEQLKASEIKEDDRMILGNGLPKGYTGLTNNFQFGNFDFSFFLRGAFGFDLLNTRRIFYENRIMVPVNINRDALESPVLDDPQFSDYYIEKGDYIKLDNITFGYNLPVNNRMVKTVRAYISGQNLATLTKYTGQDPEIRIQGLTPGMDYRWVYPSVRTFSIGFNIEF